MKAVWKYAVGLSLVVAVAGCGDKKGGVNNSGVEADGKCSSNVVDDMKGFLKDYNDAVAANDAAKAKAACARVSPKYNTVTCVVPETGKTFNGAGLAQYCN